VIGYSHTHVGDLPRPLRRLRRLRDTQAFRVTLPPSISSASDEVPILAPPPFEVSRRDDRDIVIIYRFRDEVARAHFERDERAAVLVRP